MAIYDIELFEKEQIEEGFQIDNEESAAWALRKIEKISKKCEYVVKGYDRRVNELEKEIDNVEQEKHKYIERINADLNFFKQLLLSYVLTIDSDLFDDKKTQCNIIVAGHKLSIKKPAQKIVKVNEKKLLAYLKDYDNDFINIKQSVDWAGFKKRLVIQNGNVIDPDTGSVVDGASIVDTPQELIIKE